MHRMAWLYNLGGTFGDCLSQNPYAEQSLIQEAAQDCMQLSF